MSLDFTESIVEEATLASLEALRKTLLPKLISGEQWVKDAEKRIAKRESKQED